MKGSRGRHINKMAERGQSLEMRPQMQSQDARGNRNCRGTRRRPLGVDTCCQTTAVTPRTYSTKCRPAFLRRYFLPYFLFCALREHVRHRGKHLQYRVFANTAK